jgi:hypothetical protein
MFCIGSNTEWVRVGIPPSTVQHMIVRSLVERDPAGRLALTDQGRSVLAALIGENTLSPSALIDQN